MLKIALLCLSLSTFGVAEEITFADPAGTPQNSTTRELLVENEMVRVWKTTILPSNPLKLHRHNDPRLVVGLQGGVITRITEEGERSYLPVETGKAVWLDADPEGMLHACLNESTEPLVVMVIEVKK